MPPESLPCDRKDFFKERKHERPESLGSVARWRDSSSSLYHHGSRDFARWGSPDFRRPPGHGKQGGWHQLLEEPGHGYTPSRSSDKMLEDENCRPSSRNGDGRHGRSSSRENRGSSHNQKDWKGHSWDTSNGLPNPASVRPLDVNNDQRSVDEMLSYNSHPPHSDGVNGWDHQAHLKDQHDKIVGLNGFGPGQKIERENLDWKPVKWTRSGSLSSRGSGFSHSSSSKSMGVDSNEAKAEVQPRSVTSAQSPSGDVVACMTSAGPSEETSSRKKPRLGWGEGLAKYEKKKTGPDEGITKQGIVSPRVSDCASPATPSSVACSSSPGMDDKPYAKGSNIDNDTSHTSGSPGSGFENHVEEFPFNVENLELNTIATMGSSLVELLQSDDQTAVDSNFVRSTAMNKLLTWKGEIGKLLEMTESEIDSLENELKSLKAESGSSCPCPAASSSLPLASHSKYSGEQGAPSSLLARPGPLQLESSEDVAEKTHFHSGNLEDTHAEDKDEDIDSPGTATSKFVEPSALAKEPLSSDKVNHGECFGGLERSKSSNVDVECSMLDVHRERMDLSTSADGSKLINSSTIAPNDVILPSNGDDKLCNLILASNRESAFKASEVFNNLLPVDKCESGNLGDANVTSRQTVSFVRDKVAMRKRFLRFKERVITIKFSLFQHLWKEDIRLLSVRKNRAKSQKRFELSSRTLHIGYQKYRSSIRSRLYSPGNSSLVPTPDIINFTSKLLSDCQVKFHRSALKMPSLILDKKEKLVSRFISNNGLVEDPSVVEKERAVINPWTSEEKKFFMDNLATFGKDFRKIASFLDHKTTADCVEFYYKHHKSDWFEKTKKQPDMRKQGKPYCANTYLVTSGKKWNREMNAASLDILGAASAIAARADVRAGNRRICSGKLFLGGYNEYNTSRGDDGILERCSNSNVLGSERETAAADVLAGICGGTLSSEAMSSCITSSVDPGEGYQDWKSKKVGSVRRQTLTSEVTQVVEDETCSDESCGEMDPSDWTDEEKSVFMQAILSYGKDFVKIARCVRTRSTEQCKIFFSKARKCLGLDTIHLGSGNVGTSGSDDANGGGSDTEDPCIAEIGSVMCSDKLGSKTDEDLAVSVLNMNNDESDSRGAMKLPTNLNRSDENYGTGEVDHNAAEAVDNSVIDESLAEDRSHTDFDGDNNIVKVDDSKSLPMCVDKGTAPSAAAEAGRDQVAEAMSGTVSVSPGKANDLCPSRSDTVVQIKPSVEVSVMDDRAEVEVKQLLPPDYCDRKEENNNADTVSERGLPCTVQNTNHHPGAHTWSPSDPEKPGKNGDVKLFGQIVSHPSSLKMPNSTTQENDDKPTYHPKTSCNSINQKISSHHNIDGGPGFSIIDRNNCLALENFPVRSYGFWDGNRIQTGFPSLPDSASAMLLAKYPAAFSNYQSSSSKVDHQPLQAVVNSNGGILNGVSVFPTREISSSDGVVGDYQIYRTRENNRVQPFAVDRQQRQELFSELQRRNGFEAVSSLQQQGGRFSVGMNVLGRAGILMGGSRPAVSDPVAAIKMHYAKEQNGGQNGSIVREESWRCNGDIGR